MKGSPVSLTTTVDANSVDPDQTPHIAASDLDIHCLQVPVLWDGRHKLVKLQSGISVLNQN